MGGDQATGRHLFDPGNATILAYLAISAFLAMTSPSRIGARLFFALFGARALPP